MLIFLVEEVVEEQVVEEKAPEVEMGGMFGDDSSSEEDSDSDWSKYPRK